MSKQRGGSLPLWCGALVLLACSSGASDNTKRPGAAPNGAAADSGGSHLMAYAVDSMMPLDRSVLVELSESPDFNTAVKSEPTARKLPDDVLTRIRSHLARDGFSWNSETAKRLYRAFAGADPSPISGDGQAMLLGTGRNLTYGPHIELVIPKGLGNFTDSSFPAGKFRWVASVFNIGSVNYDPLGIDAKMAGCIYVGRDNAWKIQSYLVPAATSVCMKISLLTSAELQSMSPAELTGYALDPKTVDASFSEDDIPAGARWELSRKSEQMIGVRCASRWCQIGKLGTLEADLETTPGPPTTGDLEVKRAYRLKGWFDSQVLAEKDAQGILKPSGVIGRVIPATEAEMRLHNFGDWYTVATFSIDALYSGAAVPQKYHERGFALGVQTLQMCKGTFRGCRETGQPPLACAHTQSEVYGRIKQSNGASGPVYRVCTVEGNAYRDAIYATRWTWDPSDEGLWIRCLNGCCQPKF